MPFLLCASTASVRWKALSPELVVELAACLSLVLLWQLSTGDGNRYDLGWLIDRIMKQYLMHLCRCYYSF